MGAVTVNTIYIGFDPREASAFAVTRSSARTRLSRPIPIRGVVLSDLRRRGLYDRPLEYREVHHQPDEPGYVVMYDPISQAPMATEFACSRFLVPHLAETGWALFCDCDMLFRDNLARLFEQLNRHFAVYCVKHNYQPKNTVKMDEQVQTVYSRKLWSSMMIFNCDHPANKRLTLEMVNTLPGRDLHRFCWLEDDEIGELGEEWNWVPNYSPMRIEPKCVHFTEGLPYLPGYEMLPYAEEWRTELALWALKG